MRVPSVPCTHLALAEQPQQLGSLQALPEEHEARRGGRGGGDAQRDGLQPRPARLQREPIAGALDEADEALGAHDARPIVREAELLKGGQPQPRRRLVRDRAEGIAPQVRAVLPQLRARRRSRPCLLRHVQDARGVGGGRGLGCGGGRGGGRGRACLCRACRHGLHRVERRGEVEVKQQLGRHLVSCQGRGQGGGESAAGQRNVPIDLACRGDGQSNDATHRVAPTVLQPRHDPDHYPRPSITHPPSPCPCPCPCPVPVPAPAPAPAPVLPVAAALALVLALSLAT